jgi:protein disulfide-isomerase A1
MLAVLVLLVAAARAKKTIIEKSEGIFTLTEENYDMAVEEFDNLLVYFYAPWCGHCKALGPEFVKAGQLLKERDSEIKLGRVDGTEQEALMDKHQVTGYPTLKLYRRGELVPYTGGRMAPEMEAWLDKKIGPPAEELAGLQEVELFAKRHQVAVVGFFQEGSDDLASYSAACRDYDDYGVHYPVGVTTDPAAAAHYGAQGKVVLFKKFDERKVVYEGELGVQEIRDFITENSLPTVIEFNHENAQKMFKRPNDGKSHLLVFHNRSSETFEAEQKMMARVGKEFRKEVLFTSVDVGEEDHRRMVEFLGVRHRINNDTLPSMRIVTMKDSGAPIRYRPEDTSVTEENVKDFVTRSG